MTKIPGANRPELQELPRVRDRLSFLYLSHCKVSRSDSAISVTESRGTACIPAATIGAVLLGPGTTITHRAMELLGDVGSSVIWVGDDGVRYYAHGRPLTHSSSLLMKQAAAATNTRSRIAVARRMYAMRFPGEDVSRLTMQQLRGREGSRVRSAYIKASRETGVEWSGRDYDPSDFSAGDPVNQALTVANSCLYGAAHSVIVAMGCSPGLGFVHCGHERSFVYDIADLYKAEVCIPLAFRIASEGNADIPSATRHAMRDAIRRNHLMERMVKDIRILLDADDSDQDVNVLYLWDDEGGTVRSGTSYSESGESCE